jgi:rhamnosyl/mannosyltransferase
MRQRRLLPFYRPVVHALLRRAGRIISASEDYIASSPVLSLYRDRCRVVPYGVDPARVTLLPQDAAGVAGARQRYGDRILLFVGVLRSYKGVDVLLRSMQQVNGHAVIVGRIADRDQWGALAADLNVSDRVTFTGELSEDALRVMLHACDVFVLPSVNRLEAFGIAQIEAMACGKPVVSSDLPTGVRFVNQHGKTGLLVPPGDAPALASALNGLLDDGALRERLGVAARDRALQQFSVERMVEKTLDIYRQARSAA